MNQSHRLYLLASLFVFATIGVVWRLHKPTLKKEYAVVPQTSEIRDYVPELHRAFIKKQFKENWYLLVEPADFDVNYMLDTHSPNNWEPQHTGQLHIIVLHQEDTPVGFGTYYMFNSFVGRIQFIAVDKEFRGKRYAQKLVVHAVDALKKMGAKSIKLSTRVKNESARKLYKRLGFPIVGEVKGFVRYRKEL